MTAPLTVEQVIDVDVFTVQVTLDPAEIIEALAEALRGKAEKLMLIRALPPEHSSHRQAFAELRTLLADVFTITLTPAEANALDVDLYDASTIPDQCRYCESFSVTKIEGFGMCHVHAAAADRAAEASAS
jgi:hypothetical protein